MTTSIVIRRYIFVEYILVVAMQFIRMQTYPVKAVISFWKLLSRDYMPLCVHAYNY